MLFFEHKKSYRSIKGEVPDEDYVVPLGKADLKRDGPRREHHHLRPGGPPGAGSRRGAGHEGIDVEMLDLRTLLPLDRDAILATARKTSKVLMVSEDTLTGSITGELAAIIAEDAFTSLDAPIRRLCTPDVAGMPYNLPQLEWLLPNVEKIAAALRELAAY